MKSFLISTFLVVSVVVALITGQETTTEGPGVEYGGICNGLLLQCNRHSNTVVCMRRTPNATIGADMCETGLGVDLGRCQCNRDCRGDGVFHEVGEFVPAKGVCGGFIGELCTSLNPHCCNHATCNFILSQCRCNAGFIPDAEGKRCIGPE